MYDLPGAYKRRIEEWKALEGHPKVAKPSGNAMRQIYYTEKVLPVYIKAMGSLRLQYNGDWWLQEDGDLSHGMRGSGLAQALREDNWVTNHKHPAQSPDLNPQEAIWNILKQRVRKYTWNTLVELKEIFQREWKAITQDEIRRRIDEMPERCQRLLDNDGRPIRSGLW